MYVRRQNEYIQSPLVTAADTEEPRAARPNKNPSMMKVGGGLNK